MRVRREEFLLRAGTIAALLAVWEFAGRFFLANRLPPASIVIERLGVELRSGEFWAAFQTTISALMVGLLLSIGGGITFGLVNGSIAHLERASRLFIRSLVALPIAPLIPVLISIFGLGSAIRIAAITIFSWPVVVEYTTAGVQGVERGLLDMSRSFRASRADHYRRVILPAATPSILAGVRLGVGRAVVGMVVAELIIVSVGLGALLRKAQALFQPDAVFAYVVVFLAVGLILTRLIAVIERRVLHWR